MINFHNNINAPNRTIENFNDLVNKSDKSDINEHTGHYLWGNNVIKHSDGLYYSFIEKWDDVDGLQGWVHYIRIYVSDGCDNPVGGFTNYTEITSLRSQSWSADMVGNPHIVFHNNLYYLFYIGSFYNSIIYPTSSSESRPNQRIGVATSTHPKGDWIPEPTNPILEPRPTNWDRTLTVNPYIWKDINGLWRMAYKSDNNGVLGEMRIGVATSIDLINWGGREDAPNFGGGDFNNHTLEDLAVWQEGDKWYGMITDFEGGIIGANKGVFLISNDGITFYLSENQPAWTTIIEWTDGTSDAYVREERPFIFKENGYGIIFNSVVWDGVNESFNIGRTLKLK